MVDNDGVRRFFEFAIKRHGIYVSREENQRWPWTDDPILQTYKFTNVFRELDRTTRWWRPVSDKINGPEILLATVVFRWFNRTTTGEFLFKQQDLNSKTPFEGLAEIAMRPVCPETMVQLYLSRVYEQMAVALDGGPYVTGAFIVKTPPGYDKREGVLKNIEWFCTKTSEIPDERLQHKYGHGGRFDQRELSKYLWDNPGALTLEQVWQWLCGFPYMGDFMAYEVVTDLYHTPLLALAPDIDTWANPGPGAARGLGRVFAGDRSRWSQYRDKQHLIQLMRDLLELSRREEHWPQVWPKWHMREVEHTLCEFDKYERVRLGEGKMKGVYRHAR